MRFKNYILFFCLCALSACADSVYHTPLSKAEYVALDFADAGGKERWWGDRAPTHLMEEIKRKAKLQKASPNTDDSATQGVNLLALSGGGANGAFGAGVLIGWSESGQRPEFRVVTGVSTGAIIAPFAFLGSEYDDELYNIYTNTTRDSIYQPQVLSGLISGSAVSDTTSLQNQIAEYITPELVQKIAEEHSKGRNLFVVTTHFDAMRPMIWDIGYIAKNRKKDGVDLIRQVILASASIPVLFPPVPIEWEVDGKRFTELHVDGGITRTVFAYPSQMNIGKFDNIHGHGIERDIYVILNGNSDLGYEPSSTGVLSIAQRSMLGMLQNQTNSDIERIYHLTQRDGIDFNTIEVPQKFIADGAVTFDQVYMQELLALGQSIGRKGDFWYSAPSTLRY